MSKISLEVNSLAHMITAAGLDVTADWQEKILMARVPFKHQVEDLKFMGMLPRSGSWNEPGCYSGDTEYMSPTGWKKIEDYDGGLVMQYHLDDGSSSFVTPSEYIKLPCESFLHFKSIAVDQMLSPEHRVLYQNSLGKKLVTSAYDIYTRHKNSREGWSGRFLTTFKPSLDTKIELTDAQIRVMVAVFADGSFSGTSLESKLVQFQFAKERLAQLLGDANIPFKTGQRNSPSNQGLYYFSFYAPIREKTFENFWCASLEQLHIIVDEVFHWDGHISKRDRDGRAFYTTNKGCADFIQYAIASLGRRGRLRVREQLGYGTKPVFEVSEILGSSLVSIRGDKGVNSHPIEVVSTPGAYKYCFTVPATFLVMRRDNKIFVSGNTGKTLTIQAFGLWLAGHGNKTVYVMPPILVAQFHKSLCSMFIGVEDYISCVEFKGNPAQREKLIASWDVKPTFLLMSYVMFTKYKDDLLDWGYNAVVVDEATAVKNPSSKIHKAVKAFVAEDNGLVLVTGTPVETNVEDCYGLISLITPKLYSSYRNFVYIHINQTTFMQPNGQMQFKTLSYKNMDILNANLMLQARRTLKRDVSDLPPRIITEMQVELSPKHLALYRKVVRERMLEIGEEVMDMLTAQALYQATQRLLLTPESFVPDDYENTLIEALDEIVHELAGRKILVFAWYNRSIAKLAEHYKDLNPAILNGSVTGDAREVARLKFIEDKTCQMLIANPKSGGFGIDGMQHVCSHVIYAEVCPHVGTFQQSVDRLHRTGQKAESVSIYILVAKDTVAVKLRNDLVKKDAAQEQAVKDKRAVLSDLMGMEGIQGTLDLQD